MLTTAVPRCHLGISYLSISHGIPRRWKLLPNNRRHMWETSWRFSPTSKILLLVFSSRFLLHRITYYRNAIHASVFIFFFIFYSRLDVRVGGE